MNIAFYGSSLLSSYWNGAATYYRGLLQALSQLGHHIVFYEPDAFERQSHRDIEPPSWADVVVYEANEEGVRSVVARSAEADVAIKASGVGVFDDALLLGILAHRSSNALSIYWDVDAPATLSDLRNGRSPVLKDSLSQLDFIITYGGGPPVIGAYRAAGASDCVAIYNALDPATHFPVAPEIQYDADVILMANRLPDRESRVEEFFLAPARALPSRRFLLGGSGWQDELMPSNIRLLGHVPTAKHNAVNCSALAVLNVARHSMAMMGFSPATRIFEAAGAGACVITDAWDGIELFFTPGKEILIARNGADVVAHVQSLHEDRARKIGAAARARCLIAHTYASRAEEVDLLLRAKLSHKRGTRT